MEKVRHVGCTESGRSWRIATLPNRRKMLLQTTQIYFGETISAL